jgi:Family of unknown function (DUF6516)
MARLKERHQLRADAFVELRIWLAPKSVCGSVHRFKYALAYVVAGVCVLRYDNEAGKGDHRPRRIVDPRGGGGSAGTSRPSMAT